MEKADRRILRTKIKVEWSCSDEGCETLIRPGDICYRVLDERLGFPLICGTCGGLPAGGEPICAGCLEPITKDATDEFTWLHPDGAPLRWRDVSCGCNSGRTWAGDICERCRGTGTRQSLDHEARPMQVRE